MKGLDPGSLYAVDAHPKIEQGALRALAYAEACLQRIDEVDETIGAWRCVDPDLARHNARQLDTHRLSGSPVGPLHGIPVGVQDLLDTADLPTDRGASVHARRRPSRDAAAVARMRAAGALILGKTATTELGQPGSASTRNPLNVAHSAGGAGGGCAAAVAAGTVPLAIALQSAGEIIQAASRCGVVGFKPTRGLVPRGGALQQSDALDTVGVFARCVEDVALAVDALAEHDRNDPYALPGPPPRALELARSEPPLAPSYAYVPQAAWASASKATTQGFEELGDALGERWNLFDFPDTFADGIGAHQTLLRVDLAHNLAHCADRAHELDEPLLSAIHRGRDIPAVSYLAARDWRAVLQTGVQRIFDRYEVIATPAVAGEAPGAGEPEDNAAFCVLWTLLGLPAVSLPLLEGPNGLPVGVQLVGRHGQDGRLLRTARYLCEVVAGRARFTAEEKQR